MTLDTKRIIVAVLSFLFLTALLLVAYQESKRHRVEKQLEPVVTSANSGCVTCHKTVAPAMVKDWEGSRHAHLGVGCVDLPPSRKR